MDNINPYAAPQMDISVAPALDVPPTLFGALAMGTTLYLRRFSTFAALMLAISGPLEVGLHYLYYFVLDPESAGGYFQLSLLIQVSVGIILTGAVVEIGHADLRGERLSSLSGFGRGLDAWPRIFATQLVLGIVLLFAALFLILPALYLAVRLSAASVVAVVERTRATTALSRTMEVTNGAFFRYLGLGLISFGSLFFLSMLTDTVIALVPAFNQWLVAAGLWFLVDLFSPWTILIFVAAYVASVDEERRASAPVQHSGDAEQIAGATAYSAFTEQPHDR
jgi:hypothetical protein